jgi:hypothetical protein
MLKLASFVLVTTITSQSNHQVLATTSKMTGAPLLTAEVIFVPFVHTQKIRRIAEKRESKSD